MILWQIGLGNKLFIIAEKLENMETLWWGIRSKVKKSIVSTQHRNLNMSLTVLQSFNEISKYFKDKKAEQE